MQNKIKAIGGGVIVLVAFIVIGMGIDGLCRDYQFEGKDVGRVTATIELLQSSIQGKGTSYQACYGFVIGNGQIQLRKSTVSKATYLQLRAGQQVPVKFLSSDSEKSRIDWPAEDRWHWQNDGLTIGIGFLFAALGLFLLWTARF